MKSANNFLLLLLLTVAWSFSACTDLEDNIEDRVDGDEVEVVSGSIDPAAAVQAAYTAINSFTDQAGVYALIEHSSDELQGPTRGTDWSDFGVWRQLHLHSWDPSHEQVLTSWNRLNSGSLRAAQAIRFLGSSDAQLAAEARFLRAFFQFYILDLYGQLPNPSGDPSDQSPVPILSRADGLQQVIDDLNAAIPALPNASQTAAGKANKQAAQFLLAKALLNRGVFTASNPAGPYDFASGDMQQVIDLADAVAASGEFDLEPAGEYFDSFAPDNRNSSDELIFVIANTRDNIQGNVQNRYRMTLHYRQNPDGWNGFTTVADFYNRWNQEDERFNTRRPEFEGFSGMNAGFLVGQQTDAQGNPITERGGAPLIFTPEVDLLYAGESEGVRVIKYIPDYPDVGNPNSDYVLFRYADLVLMKAEAQWRSGDGSGAVATLNEVRTRRGVPAINSIDGEGSELLNERGFELYWEGWRRNDQIRFGTFLEPYQNKEFTSPESAVLFPIPQLALDTHPNLVQNAGY